MKSKVKDMGGGLGGGKVGGRDFGTWNGVTALLLVVVSGLGHSDLFPL